MILKIYKKKRRIFFVFLTAIIFIVAILGILRLSIETDIFKLFPENNKIFDSFKKSVKLFGGMDFLIIFLEIPDPENLEIYTSFIDELCEEFKKIEEGINILCHPPDPKPYFEFFLKNLIVLSNDLEWDLLTKKLKKEKIKETLFETKMELLSLIDPDIKSFLLIDPLKLHRIYLERFNKPIGAFKIDYLHGYFLSEDHKAVLIFLKPKGSPQNLKYLKTLIEKTEKIIKEKVSTWKYNFPKPVIKTAGGFKITYEDAKIIKKDIKNQIIFSIILVLLLYYFFFKTLKSLILPLFPLGLGLIFTFGFAGFFLRSLNAPSSAFAALLVGLGIDFVIIMYSRFIEEKENLKDLNQIFYTIEKETYPSIFLCAITTVGTFGIFYFTKMKGLKELGLLTSIGIIFVMFFTFTILPSILIFEERLIKEKKLYKSFTYFASSIMNFSKKNKKFIILLSILLLPFSFYFARKIPYYETAESLRSKKNEGIIVQEKISEKFGRSSYPSIVLIKSKDFNDLTLLDSKLHRFLEHLKKKNIIFSHQGLSDLLPPLEKQKRNLERKNQINFKSFEADFIGACKELNLNPQAFSSFLENIKFSFEGAKVLEWDNLNKFKELINLNQIVLKEDENFYAFRIIYFPEGKFKREPPKELEDFIDKNPQMSLTGINAVSKELRKIAKKEAFFVTILGFTLIFFLILLFFKSFKKTFLSLIPFISGIFLMLGVMGFFKIPFNSINIFVVLMIIGIGTDYGIHLVHRYYISEKDFNKILSTGTAVLFSSLTTIAGFGSLVLSHFPGLKSIGYIAILGTFFTSLFTLTLLPAILNEKKI